MHNNRGLAITTGGRIFPEIQVFLIPYEDRSPSRFFHVLQETVQGPAINNKIDSSVTASVVYDSNSWSTASPCGTLAGDGKVSLHSLDVSPIKTT